MPKLRIPPFIVDLLCWTCWHYLILFTWCLGHLFMLYFCWNLYVFLYIFFCCVVTLTWQLFLFLTNILFFVPKCSISRTFSIRSIHIFIAFRRNHFISNILFLHVLAMQYIFQTWNSIRLTKTSRFVSLIFIFINTFFIFNTSYTAGWIIYVKYCCFYHLSFWSPFCRALDWFTIPVYVYLFLTLCAEF